MTLVDLGRGLGTMLFITIVAGGVAYVGDRVGHQVGRKRLTLFGIRPRYTSTIVAIGTGMTIALVVMLGAILASQNVKTAFFRLNSINQQITELRSQQQQLEAKVNNGRLVFQPDTLMVPFYLLIRQSQTPAQRFAALRSYYTSAIRYMNETYAGNASTFGLRPYKAPADIDRILQNDILGTQSMTDGLAQGDMLVTIGSSQNLFAGDPIHFEINAIGDARRFVKGQPIASIKVPGNAGASANLAIQELQTVVANAARRAQMPSYLANNVQAGQIVPDPAQMQAMLAKPGTYYMTAYAAEDVYPHTGGVPITIALTVQPAHP